MQLNVVNIIYALGALQGFILLVGININKPLQTSLKKAISLLMASIFVVMVYYLVLLNEYDPIYPYIDSLGSAAWMAICPTYYLICRSLTSPQWQLSWKHLALFPFTILFMIEALITTLGFEVWMYKLVDNNQLFLDLWVFAFFSSGFFFMIKSIRLIRQQDDIPFHKELKWFGYIFLTVLIIFSCIFLFIRTNYKYSFELILIGLFECLIFAFIYRMFKIASFPSLFPGSKYSNKTLVEEKRKQLAQQLEKVMISEKSFLDKKLSLATLSQQTNISTNDLSQLFNLHYQSNFYEYINRYRLDYLEQILLDPDYTQYKITALAELSGFNSKATFYKVFKERHHMTPVEYVKKQQAS